MEFPWKRRQRLREPADLEELERVRQAAQERAARRASGEESRRDWDPITRDGAARIGLREQRRREDAVRRALQPVPTPVSSPDVPQVDNLTGILQQVDRLREQQRHSAQTETEYRETIINSVNSLRAICLQPDIRAALSQEVQSHPTTLLGSFNGRFFNPVDTNIPEKPAGIPIILTIDNSFYLEMLLFDQSPSKNIKKSEKKNDKTSQLIVEDLNRLLQLDTSTPWHIDRVHNKTWINNAINRLRKEVTVEDFIRHPEWLELFQTNLSQRLTEKITSTEGLLAEKQGRIAQFSGKSFEEVVEELRAGIKYTEQDLHLAAQDAAQTLFENIPPLPTGVSIEQVGMIFTQMFEERFAALQSSPEIQQRTSSPNETIMERFIRRSKDPKKMSDLILKLSSLIPGFNQVITILEAINIMFGPDPKTR